MRFEDAPGLLALYQRFAALRVGMARRCLKHEMWQIRDEKDNIRLVATRRSKIVGYSLCWRYAHREAAITELVVDPDESYEVALSLISETKKQLNWKPAVLCIRSILEPADEEVINTLGLLKIETETIFMMAVIDTPMFLENIAPILSSRLSKVRDWNGVLTLSCAGAAISLAKEGSNVRRLGQNVVKPDLEIALKPQTLVKLLLGVTSAKESVSTRALKISNRILPRLFPKKTFLIFERW